MQAITVIIRITGLLLLTPRSQNPDGGPTYVLMPKPSQTSGVPEHVAQIGYLQRQAGGQACRGTLVGVECYVDIGRWSVTLDGVADPTTPVGIPPEAVNLKQRLNGTVPSSAFLEKTEFNTLSRVILRAGRVTGRCTSGPWKFARSASDPTEEDLPLANAVVWEMSRGTNTRLTLERTQIHALGRPTTEPIVTLTSAGVADPIQLMIRNVPKAEGNGPFGMMLPGSRASASRHRQPRHRPGRRASARAFAATATHFAAYYEYLNITNPPPFPHRPDAMGTCVLSSSGFAPLVIPSPSSPTCMMIAGGP